jgi:aspartate aminotransferase
MALSEQTRDPFATLAPWVDHVKESATLAVSSQAAKMRAQGIDVISLNAGEPDFDTPEHVKQAAIDALHQGKTKYTVVDGMLDLRQAICDKLARDQKVQYQPNEILVSTGAKQSLYNFFMAFLRPGDEVIIPAPFWVSYPPQVELAGGKPVIVTATQAQDFKITPQQLEAAVTPRTRALVLNSPSNPTGSVYTLAELQAIAAVAERHRIVIISDEIYEKLRFDGATSGPTPAAFSPQLRNLTVVVNGFSKAYAMTGWRIGYAAGPRAIIEAMSTLQSQSTSNCTTPTQFAALAALRGGEEFLAPMVAEYKKRRDFVVSRLNSISGLSSNTPQGAFYVMANVTGLYGKKHDGNALATDHDVASFFLNVAHVATVPGEPFGAPGYLRLSFATSMEALEKSLSRVEEAIKTKLS